MYIHYIFRVYTMNILEIFIVYPRYIIIKKGTEQTHEVLTRYIPDISIRTAYTCNIPCIYHVYTIYILCIYHSYTNAPSLMSIYHVYTMYIHIISLYDHLILHEPLHCRVSWHLSAHSTAQSWIGGQQARCSWWSRFWFPWYTSSAGKIHVQYVQAGGWWVPFTIWSNDLLGSLPDPSSYTTAKTIQRLLNQDGTARDRCKDRVRFWWQILCLYFIYAWHILCIYYVYQRILNWISIVYVMYIPSKFFGYAWHIPCIYYVYQRILNWISFVYVMYIPSKFFGSAWHIPCIYYVYQRILNWISRHFKCDIQSICHVYPK